MHCIKSSAALSAGLFLSAYAETGDQHNASIELFNPAVSVVVDAFYHHDNSEEGLAAMKEEMPGFGHQHSEEAHSHGLENGFNLREVELYLSGEVDDFLSLQATVAIHYEDVEVETAAAETQALPWGLTLKAGKFFSDFGIGNAQHPHTWSFSDQPLIHELALGSHGLNEIGIQAAWMVERPLHIHAGIEAFQGENERMFAHEAEEDLPHHNGPRLGVGWLKVRPDIGHTHTLEFGLFGAGGYHQEIHEETAGVNSYLDGISYFAGGDLFYRYHAHGKHGQGDLTLQSEYFLRNKQLDLIAADDPGAPIGQTVHATQDGYYLQMLYGILPRWRAGIRWDQTGLTNEEQEPGEANETFGDSWRATAMVDFRPSDSTTIRLQIGNGDYETADGAENIWETYLQMVVTLGAHRHTDPHTCPDLH